MHVSAKDKQTGKNQAITIRSSGGLSKDQIEKFVREAEEMKDQDERQKETIEIKNEADSLVYQTEKQLQEHKDKIPQNTQDLVRSDIANVQQAIGSDDPATIKEAVEKLRNSAMEIGKSIYQQQDQSQQQQQTGEQPNEEENKDK